MADVMICQVVLTFRLVEVEKKYVSKNKWEMEKRKMGIGGDVEWVPWSCMSSAEGQIWELNTAPSLRPLTHTYCRAQRYTIHPLSCFECFTTLSTRLLSHRHKHTLSYALTLCLFIPLYPTAHRASHSLLSSKSSQNNPSEMQQKSWRWTEDE